MICPTEVHKPFRIRSNLSDHLAPCPISERVDRGVVGGLNRRRLGWPNVLDQLRLDRYSPGRSLEQDIQVGWLASCHASDGALPFKAHLREPDCAEHANVARLAPPWPERIHCQRAR